MSALRRRVRRWRVARRLRHVRLNVIARTSGHQDLTPIVEADDVPWREVLTWAESGPRVLIATNIGGHFGLAGIDRLLAVALTLRGAKITTVLCDGVLPACQMCEFDLVAAPAAFARQGPDHTLCAYCHGPACGAVSRLGLAVRRLSSVLTSADEQEAQSVAEGLNADQIESFRWNDLPVGEHAAAGALRYYARSEIRSEPAAERILRRYLIASILTARAYDRVIEQTAPEVMVAHHGIYVPQGIAAAVARSRGVRVVTWNPAYRRHCFIFSHDDTYHQTMMTEPVALWRDRPLSAAEGKRIRAYLKSRRDGRNDWIIVHHAARLQPLNGVADLALDPAKPVVLLLTNVFWDAQLHYRTNAFRNQGDWLVRTIAWFANRPDLQLVVRIHPAEVTTVPAARQRAAAEIEAAFPRLPGNVRVIGPESAISTYALARLANSAIIFATKTGVELACEGLPVIVAGEAWVRNKGLTFDAHSEADYFRLLAQLPFASRLDEQTIELAERYANHFFFGRMIPLEMVDSVSSPRRFTVTARNRTALKPGSSVGLDVICRGILNGEPFIMPPLG